MPSAIVTVRDLKNKDSGIDISIPVYKEIKGLLHSSWEFYVVVVSNLQYFKSPKHKDNDVVQFMVQKRQADFETLHAKLTEKFPATILPSLPKKTLITSENAVKEKKLTLEKFLQFIAVTNKLVNCSVFLEFLGVNAIKAGKFRTEVDETDDKETTDAVDKEDDKDDGEQEQASDMFGDGIDDDDESDLFATDMFPEDTSTNTFFQEDTKIFDNPDLRGSIEDGEESDLFVPGSNIPAIITKTIRVPVEDNSDLLQIEDDLNRFLNVEEQKKDIDDSNKTNLKPTQKQKPTTSPKPSISPKPGLSVKPALPTKPVSTTTKPETNIISVSESDVRKESNNSPNEVDSISKTTTPSRPPIPKKPSKPSIVTDNKISVKTDSNGQKSRELQSLETNDILQYIEANTEQEDEIDLFS
ncbi:HCLS1-binding protein 3-like [Mytilus trossulus]|uniref:HCLS1-binding protein 3-like n=1 Tax=Mytilus trossulus TaxID=6551 RepID=UPI003006227E